MARTPEIVDFELIDRLRQNGRSFPWIGRALALAQGRSISFQANSVQTAYRRWLDERGIAAAGPASDMRSRQHRRGRR
jgi:hypothetical protein